MALVVAWQCEFGKWVARGEVRWVRGGGFAEEALRRAISDHKVARVPRHCGRLPPAETKADEIYGPKAAV